MKSGIERISIEDAAFPARMKELSGMPKVLNYKGRLPSDMRPSAAIIGGRKCSAYGRSKAYELGEYLARHGVQVISGLALGIDSYAHEGALKAKGDTFAVLGCGADICYPASNIELYKMIADTGGIISEFPDGTKPMPYNFPRRNRIISALSDIVIVIEARINSGSLITANYALEQGKTVYAYPDRMGSYLSEGSNRLIADGAGIVYSPEVILSELGIAKRDCGTDGERHGTAGARKTEQEKKEENTIYAAIGYDPLSVEEIAGKCGKSADETEQELFELLLSGLIKELPGHLFVKF